MEPAQILIIEDDQIVSRTIERSLRGSVYQIRTAHNGMTGLQAARQSPPDLVILDVIMPGMDGYAVCREMRADPQLRSIPILFLTAKVKDEDRIQGFQAGADDYLCKPFNISELSLRVQAILRRTHRPARRAEGAAGTLAAQMEAPGGENGKNGLNSGGPQAGRPEASRSEASRSEAGRFEREANGTQLRVGDFTLDSRSYELTTPNRGKILLTPVQFNLLYHLMVHPGEIFTPARLLDEVWDYPTEKGSPDLVRVHIKTLRERIERNPRSPTFLVTIPGRGYTIQPDG